MQSVVDICSFLRDTGHLEIEELHNLPVFQRSMDLATAEYRQCSFESFTMLLKSVTIDCRTCFTIDVNDIPLVS